MQRKICRRRSDLACRERDVGTFLVGNRCEELGDDCEGREGRLEDERQVEVAGSL